MNLPRIVIKKLFLRTLFSSTFLSGSATCSDAMDIEFIFLFQETDRLVDLDLVKTEIKVAQDKQKDSI